MPGLHGIRSLSPSSLNLWRRDRAAWAVRYVLGVSDGRRSWAACRGDAVEAGVVHAALHPETAPEEAARAAVTDLVRALGRRDEALEALARDSVLHGAAALRRMALGPAVAAQVLVKEQLPDLPIPILGYVDLLCIEGSVDVKSSVRCWREAPDEDELLQMAVYASLTNRPARLLYVGGDGACAEDGAEPFGPEWEVVLGLARELVAFLASCVGAAPEEVVVRAGPPRADCGWTWPRVCIEAWESASGEPFAAEE